MTKPTHSVSVAAVVTDDRGHVLVVQRRDNGRWEIPGGILERGESIHAGLRREVSEETGLTVEPKQLTGVYKNLRLGVVALVFRAVAVGGELSPTEEASHVEWWPPATINQKMGETFAIRVKDALDNANSVIRVHDGIHVLNEDAALTAAMDHVQQPPDHERTTP